MGLGSNRSSVKIAERALQHEREDRHADNAAFTEEIMQLEMRIVELERKLYDKEKDK